MSRNHLERKGGGSERMCLKGGCQSCSCCTEWWDISYATGCLRISVHANHLNCAPIWGLSSNVLGFQKDKFCRFHGKPKPATYWAHTSQECISWFWGSVSNGITALIVPNGYSSHPTLYKVYRHHQSSGNSSNIRRPYILKQSHPAVATEQLPYTIRERWPKLCLSCMPHTVWNQTLVCSQNSCKCDYFFVIACSGLEEVLNYSLTEMPLFMFNGGGWHYSLFFIEPQLQQWKCSLKTDENVLISGSSWEKYRSW